MKRTTISTQQHLYMVQVNELRFLHRQNGNINAAEEFPLSATVPTWQWTDDLKQAIEWFTLAEAKDEQGGSEVHVILSHCEIDALEFSRNWPSPFIISDKDTQEAIPYEVDFSLTEIARRKI